MNWILVNKSATPQPASGTYKDWKSIIRIEGDYQCVYCAIAEAKFGGLRNFHVEHYRPKKSFSSLVNTISNLFYICAICNSFKGSDWPAEPKADWSNSCYPDPSSVDYSRFLGVDGSYVAVSQYVAGNYVIERLYLNRPQLIMARRLDGVTSALSSLTSQIVELLDGADPDAVARAALGLANAVILLSKLPSVRPYEPAHVRR